MSREYGPSMVDRLAQGEQARLATISRARQVLGGAADIASTTISPVDNSGRRFQRISGAALPLLAATLVLSAFGVRPEPVSAQEGFPTSSEEPLIPEPKKGNPYIRPVDDALWFANDEVRVLMTYGLLKRGDCVKVLEVFDPVSLAKNGPDEVTYREVFIRVPDEERSLLNGACEVITPAPRVEIPAVTPAVAPAVAPAVSTEACPPTGFQFGLPSRHSEVPVADINTHGKWFNPVYDALRANAARNWEGIGPHYPIAFAAEPNAAHLKTYGNVGEFVIVGDGGGKVWLALWQEAQHQNEGKWGEVNGGRGRNDSWKMQYTFKGLPVGAQMTLFDPDTGAVLDRWPDGSLIGYTANHLGTAAFEVPSGEARWGVCFNMPGQQQGVQLPEVIVTQGSNDKPGLRGENPLPPAVVKPGMPD